MPTRTHSHGVHGSAGADITRSPPKPFPGSMRIAPAVNIVALANFRPKYSTARVGVRLTYHLYGTAPLPVVIVQGGISATRHLVTSPCSDTPGWWDDIVGMHRAIDLNTYRVLSMDYLTDFQCRDEGYVAISTEDQADALTAVLDVVGIERVHAFVGASYGAMVGLAFAALHPRRLTRLIAISGADRPHPMATAFRSIQRDIIRKGLDSDAPREHLALARALGLVTYSSHQDFEARFSESPRYLDGQWSFQVAKYLRDKARRFASRVTPQAYLRLSESLDLHQVDPARIRVPVTLVAVHPDQVVPMEQMRALARMLGTYGRLIEFESCYGHDAFLKEPRRLSPLLCTALTDENCKHEHIC